MNKLPILLILIFIISACSQKEKQIPPYKNPDLPVNQRVEDLLSRMTQEEKFWQCFMVYDGISDSIEKVQHGIFGYKVDTKQRKENVGEVPLDNTGGGTARQNAEQANKMQKYFVEQTRLGIPITYLRFLI